MEAADQHGLSPSDPPGCLRLVRPVARPMHPGAVPVGEVPVTPRRDPELLVCADGQVNRTFRSRPLLGMALEEFERKQKPPRMDLRTLLGLETDRGDPMIAEIKAGTRQHRQRLCA